MVQLSSSEMKKLLRLNIIRHREKLLKCLGNINDTTLRNKIIKLHPRHPIDSDLLNELKRKPPLKVEVKVEIIDEVTPKCESADDNVYVGSDSEWQSICENENDENEILVKTRRRSSRKNDVHHNNTLQEDFVYDMPHAVGTRTNQKKKSSRQQLKIGSKRYFIPVSRKINNALISRSIIGNRDRSVHNAKERACRENIAKLFSNLSEICSCLHSTRRYPSKHSILLAAKKECEILKDNGKKLIAEKEELNAKNEKLRKKMKKLSDLDNSKKSNNKD